MRIYIAPELAADDTGRAHYNLPENRRHSYRQLQFYQRYGITLRAPYTLHLSKDVDFRIGELESVRSLTNSTMFDGLVVLRDDVIIYEKYAPDFGPDQHHAILSAIKTVMHLIIGKLWSEGKIDLNKVVADYIPQVSTGYSKSTVQDVLDMNVVNDAVDGNFSFSVVEPYGVRFMPDRDVKFRSLRELLSAITGVGGRSPDGRSHYKTANADLLGWIAEVCAGAPLRQLVLEIVEAAGLADVVFWRTDRTGVPTVGGGVHLTTRDFARYGLLLARDGVGIRGEQVGSKAFTDHTIATCKEGTLNHEEEASYYRNAVNINGALLDQWGWAGQRLTVHRESRTVVAFVSTLDSLIGTDFTYLRQTACMAEDIVSHVSKELVADEATRWRRLQPI
jgi:CubicO group peptidase (beta-lactamase class C family)